MRVLVVDDSSTMRKVLLSSLENLHFKRENCDEASDGIIAWNLIQENQYNLILTE